jgi:hypothetical protein
MLAAAAMGGAAMAQAPQARMTPQEAAQMVAAAGLIERGGPSVNQCNRPAHPRFAFGDLNGDGRPEAIVAEIDPVCYGGTGEKASILWRDPSGRWQLVGAVQGRMTLLQTSSRGWREYTLEGAGCQPVWGWDGARYVIQRNTCGANPKAAAAPPAAPPPMATGGAAADRAAAFRAIGAVPVRGRYMACNKQGEMEIEIRDLNGDGRPDAVIQDFGTECYGMTEQGFSIVTKDANGAWRRLYNSQGIPDFLTTRGAGGWPDIVVGGPGFCFPVTRWNGQDYAVIRWQADPSSPRACAGRKP